MATYGEKQIPDFEAPSQTQGPRRVLLYVPRGKLLHMSEVPLQLISDLQAPSQTQEQRVAEIAAEELWLAQRYLNPTISPHVRGVGAASEKAWATQWATGVPHSLIRQRTPLGP